MNLIISSSIKKTFKNYDRKKWRRNRRYKSRRWWWVLEKKREDDAVRRRRLDLENVMLDER